MGYISPKGRDWSSVVNWDDLGKLYASIAIAWTATLFAGIVWLLKHRREASIKIRNIPLAVASTIFLHVYLVKILLAYTTNGHFLCSLEFWIMSIYLPFGIALFQANMTQLHSISNRQKKLFDHQLSFREKSLPLRRRIFHWSRWNDITAVRKTQIFIAIGMILQVVATAAIYATSPKLHGDWGKISHTKGQAKCRKGWEWIPSTIWQLFWSWFYGPYVLYKIRNIRDVHNWRIQTILCVISGLPGSPIWLASLYSQKFHPVNKYWVPPMWLAPGIFVMQAVTIFGPIFETYQNRSEIRSTLDIIKSWEEGKHSDESTINSGSTRRFIGRPGSSSTATSSKSREMYTMAALEKALAVNPTPLFQFAATRDFTGENIAFLMQVSEWKAAWSRADIYASPIAERKNITHRAKTNLFKHAAEIYASNVDNKTAEFPINLESKLYTDLERIFGPAISDVPQHFELIVDPFNVPPEHGSPKASPELIGLAITSPEAVPLSSPTKEVAADILSCVDAYVETSSIHLDFDEHVFDAAEQSIKYLVLTNTWRKFVDGSKENILI